MKQTLPLQGDQDYGKSDVTREKRTDEKTQRGDFHAALNSFAMLDLIIDPISMFDFNASSNAWSSFNAWSNFIPYAWSNSKVLLPCSFTMSLSTTISQRFVKHFWIHYTFKEGQVDTLLEIAFYLCYKETILIF